MELLSITSSSHTSLPTFQCRVTSPTLIKNLEYPPRTLCISSDQHFDLSLNNDPASCNSLGFQREYFNVSTTQALCCFRILDIIVNVSLCMIWWHGASRNRMTHSSGRSINLNGRPYLGETACNSRMFGQQASE